MNTDHKHVSDHDQSSILKVICSQRDRFRTHLRETEEAGYSIFLDLHYATPLWYI
uniref:Protein CASP isoform X2 n=1 Tax=Rhizophora mucronata TaxID=61149 RepID=A0A2P2M2F1_RHIMU